MGLQQTLDRMKQDFVARAPAATLEIMQQATARLAASGILEKILSPGTRAPQFSLQDATGETVDSRKLLKQGPLLLTFYRGIW
ncbi:MAG: hypothetical protein RQ754_00140 [Desulfuromonadales bacterium]|jgi:hypothetical protein|nr:hypothetical protein [Desulfuromonadales bacterium]